MKAAVNASTTDKTNENQEIEEEDEDEYLAALCSYKQIVISPDYLQICLENLAIDQQEVLIQAVSYISQYSTSCAKDLYSKLSQEQLNYLISLVKHEIYQGHILQLIRSLLKFTTFSLSDEDLMTISQHLFKYPLIVLDIYNLYCSSRENQIKFLRLKAFDPLFNLNFESQKMWHKFLKLCLSLYTSPFENTVPLLESKFDFLDQIFSINEIDPKTVAIALKIYGYSIYWSQKPMEHVESLIEICFKLFQLDSDKISFRCLVFLENIAKYCPNYLTDYFPTILELYSIYHENIRFINAIFRVLSNSLISDDVILPIIQTFYSEETIETIFNVQYDAKISLIKFTSLLIRRTPESHLNFVLNNFIFDEILSVIISDPQSEFCNEFIQSTAYIVNSYGTSPTILGILKMLDDSDFLQLLSESDFEHADLIIDAVSNLT